MVSIREDETIIFVLKRYCMSAEPKCECGCGETIPWIKYLSGEKFVNEKHAIARRRRDAWERNFKKLNGQENYKTDYCKSYNKNNIDCIRCYEDQVAKYRGCYEKPQE